MTRILTFASLSLVGAFAACATTNVEIGRQVPGGSGGGAASSSTAGGAGGAGGTTTSSTGGTGGAMLLCVPSATQACYGGPAATEGHGICKAGTRTCAPDGMSWGSCAGDVLPQVENCATPEDDDCDGFAPECTGTQAWSRSFGAAGDQLSYAVAVDKDGNIVIAGAFSGTIDFGGGVQLSAAATARDIFVAKLDATGVVSWAKSFPTSSSALSGGSVAVDPWGAIFLGGGFAGTIDFGAGASSSAGLYDVFVVKLDPSGSVVWGKRFGAAGNEELGGLAVDASGSVVVTGNTDGAVDFGGGALAGVGSMDLFAVKLDGAGGHVWSKRFGDGSAQHGRAVAVSGAGDVAIAGQAAGSIDFGCGALPDNVGNDPVLGGDVVLARLSPAGTCLWSKRFGDGAKQDPDGVAIDAAGAVIVTGHFEGVLDFGGGPLTSAGKTDLFVAKLDAAGGYVWGLRAGDGQDQLPRGIAVDAAANVLVTGYFAGSMDLGGGTLVSTGGSVDVFLAKLSGSTGAHLWSRRFGDAQAQYATGVAADPAGNAVVTGYFLGTLDFGGNALASAGGRDLFVTKFTP
jgi:hypothetical protein